MDSQRLKFRTLTRDYINWVHADPFSDDSKKALARLIFFLALILSLIHI